MEKDQKENINEVKLPNETSLKTGCFSNQVPVPSLYLHGLHSVKKILKYDSTFGLTFLSKYYSPIQ